MKKQIRKFMTGTEPSIFGEMDLHLFNEGNHLEVYKKLGAVPGKINGVRGYNFSVWAPNAIRVSVVGDFNNWDGKINQMHSLGNSGIWELFIPGITENSIYKFEIKTQQSLFLKSDPYGKFYELRPKNASITYKNRYNWTDKEWLGQQESRDLYSQPLSIYEVHLGSWKRKEDGTFMNYREIAYQIVSHVKEYGFNCIQLMPVSEHPFDASWGYQTTGFYAPTSRYGAPDDFCFLVDWCHKNNIKVIADWTPAHFPKDGFGLYFFDGTHLYEHADPKLRDHPDWQSAIFNYGRHEVRNFLIGSAINWFDTYHIDAIRTDAVASMLYLDYSRKNGEWIPNKYGGNENLDAVYLIRNLNQTIYKKYPHAFTIAEESTAWPGVSKPVYLGGLGFGFKWNMGWMHDTLLYFSKDPVHRKYHHNNLTFSLLYAFTENFILPLSHDEVVYGKRSLLEKMSGDNWQRFANLRLLYGWQFGHPGKKLIFMGGEFAQRNEWDCNSQLQWELLQYAEHKGIGILLKDLNRLYMNDPALSENDTSWESFQWIDFSDYEGSIVSFIRWDKKRENCLIFIFNFTPVARNNYQLGVPFLTSYREILNSDSIHYGGSNVGNGDYIHAINVPIHQLPAKITITLPPLGFLVLKPGF
ncbi:MAG: 1,4-alpha-glucan branching protein GlgB [Candidatus Omnitrophica bacterium]|nr:1,4-alpha-glucan branching protein GlgB [Candidatus Omnitrophota bacterium]